MIRPVFCLSIALVAAHAVADFMTFPPGSFDTSNPNYVGEHVVLATQIDGFFPEGSFSSGYEGVAYQLGEEITTTSVGSNLSDATGLGIPDNLTAFNSEANLQATPGLGGTASSITLDHGQFGELTNDADDSQTRNFLSTLASQIVGETFVAGDSATFQLLVQIDSLLQQAGLVGASEGLSVQVVEFLDSGGIREILGLTGFYFIDSDGNESIFYEMTDGDGASTDITDMFSFTPDGSGGTGSANFSYAMDFEVPAGSSIGVLMLSDIGVDTFGVGTVQVSTQFTTSYTLSAVTPGAGLLLNNRPLIPEPSALLLAAGLLAIGSRRGDRR